MGTNITVGELIKNNNSSKPVTGTVPGSGTFLSPTQSFTHPADVKSADPSNTAARVGDWVRQPNGSWKVVPDSNTDLTQRLYVLHGGSNKKQDLSFGDVVGAATSTIAEGWMANSVAKHIPVVGQIYELVSTPLLAARFANKLQDAESKYLDEYLNQEVDYDIAADRIVNEDGTVTWKVNYDKMKDAGYGSGSDIKKYTDTTDTKAMLLGNGSIRLDVSPVFAASDRYNELVDRLNEQFPNGITREDADEVVDEETGDTMLDKINKAVKAEEDQFYYNAATFSRLKQVAPNASDEALQEAADTQLIGKFDVKTLEKNDVEVTIYTTDNTKEKVNAKTYLDGIKNMSKGERDDYMSSISNRIQSNDISDDEKAVLQAQANALYAASHNDGEYHGIYERDFIDVISDCPYRILPRAGEAWNFFVSVAETPLKWFGVDTSGGEEALMNKRLETFYDDEIMAPLVRGAMALYNARRISKDTQQIEELIRGGASKIIGNSAKSAKWLPSFIAQVSSDLPIELARAMTYGAAGEDFNFWDEMKQDLVADAIFSTKGRRSVVEALNMPKYEYRRYRRGTDTSVKYEADEADLKADEIRDNNAKDIYDDEFDDGDLYPTGTGIREDAGLVEITANELATRRAETLMKHSNKVTLKVMELFFDKNAAQARIAIAIKANGGSTDDFRKALFYAGDIREVSKAMMSEFTRFSSVKTDYKEMGEKILNAVGDKKDFTQDDINYINASANRHRFLAENKGDKDAEDYIHKTYDPYINKVDPERAKELDDVMASYRKMASNVLDFYVEKGLISKEEAKRMRNSPAYKGGMFMPVWSKGAGLNGKWGKEIGQGRTKNKKVFNKEELIAVEDLEHPFTSLTQYIDNAMRNVAINEKAMFFRDMAAKYPGMDIRLYSDTGGALSEVENLKEINKDFAKKYDDIVAVVKQEYPSHQKWMTMNGDLVMKSKALSTAEDLKKLKQETTNLRAKQTRMRKAQDAYLKGNAIGKQPNLQKLQGSLDKAQERYDKAAERFKKASEAVRNADDSISIEERTKISNEYTKAEANFNKAEKSLQKAENKLAEAIKTGNFQHEFTSEKELELELDPEVTKALKKTRKKYRTLEDVLKGGLVDDTFDDVLSQTMYDSYVEGKRSSVGDPDLEVYMAINRIKAEAGRNADSRIFDSEKPLTNEQVKEIQDEEYAKALDKYLSDEEKDFLISGANDLRKTERKKVLTSRNNALAMFEEAKKMAYEYGISGIMSVQEGKFTGENEDAQAYYTPTPNNARAVIDSEGNVVYYAPDNAVIRISLHGLNDVDVMKSVIIHEYAHAAFDRAANRVPILNSLLQKMGYNVEVSEAVANSRDATELIAHITESRFLKDLDKWDAEYFGNDSIVQRHLNQMMKNLDVQDEELFKDGFIKMMKVAVTYVKGKLTGMLSKVTTFDEFYSGLVNGDFADEMRINTAGTKFSNAGALRNYVEGVGNILEIDHSMNVKWDKIDIPGLKMAEDIQKVQDQIDANGVKEAEMLDRIKNEAAELIEEARKLSKGAPVELDTDSFIDVQLTNALKEAMKRNNDIGQVQNVLNEIVQAANPYVSRNSVIKVRTAEAAKKFRKNLHAHIKFKEMQGKKKKLSSDHINAVADKVADAVTEKVVGKRAKVSAINDAELTRILNEGGDGHTIRYLVDGKEQRYTFTGKGSEEFVKEFYSPEFVIKGPIKQKLLNAARFIANKKRELTTSFDPTRVLPNIARDWSRGIVTTGGEIILSPDDLRTEALERWNEVPEAQEKINNGFKLAQENQEGTTFTKSMETPKKNRPKAMVKALRAENGNAYTRYRAKTTDEKLSMLQDMGESLTRNRAMTNAYYDELIKASARGEKIDVAIEKAVNAAYFYGREATTNFFRRGKLIATVAQNVPYLSQKFASLESFTYAYLDNPIAVGRALKATVGAYSALIALALSNDESRKKYYLLTEYDRSNNIIIPLTNDMIMTIPLDENIAAFLTPYRRMIESLNGVDPEAFYLWGADFLAALSPLDLTGFSEGDGFNVVRGLQKLGSEIIPTWALPILESWTGTDWHYGTDIRVDEEYVGAHTGNYTPTPGELTTKSNNSKTLAAVSDGTGIPQWILQRFMQQYGGNVGQYVINGIDKLTGATQEEQGGKDFVDAIFKPFTGMDSDNASQAFWNGVNQIEDRKKKLQNELRTLKGKIESSAGEEKAKLQKERQEKIAKYGTDITDFIDQYLSAYEITGGLTKQQANRVWRLYSIYDQDKNESLYNSGSVEEYFADKAQKSANKKANNLAARSGIDKYYVSNGLTDYDTSYAMKSLKDTIYGVPTQQMVDIANILENTEDFDNSFTKMRSDVRKARSKLYDEQRWDERDQLAYQYDYKILQAIYPYLLEHGVAETLNNETVIDYLEDWIIVPSEEQKTAKGKYVPNLGKDAQKEKAFKKQFIKKMLGVAGE